MRASDMDENTKRAILNKVRDEVGSYKYSEMVDKIGEDGLIDLLLMSAEREKSGSSSSSSGSSSSSSDSSGCFEGAVGVVGGIALIYGIFRLVVWLYGGVAQWWSWLWGHF
ncbi:MAG: hypothetical protein K8T10_21900 [Candidatus Eremiobacteraeota bacterium]|nr:hypothetical protein [Candidatus Eremiobacteraeota bacterium]